MIDRLGIERCSARHIGIFSVHSTARTFLFFFSCYGVLGIGVFGNGQWVDRGVSGNKGILRYHGKNTPLELLDLIEPCRPRDVLKLAVLTVSQCLRSPWTSWTRRRRVPPNIAICDQEGEFHEYVSGRAITRSFSAILCSLNRTCIADMSVVPFRLTGCFPPDVRKHLEEG